MHSFVNALYATLSDCRIVGLSDCRIVGLSGCWVVGKVKWWRKFNDIMSHQYVVFVSNFLWSNHTKMDYWLSFIDQNRFEWIRNSMSKFLLNMIDSCLTSKYFHWIFHSNAYFQMLLSNEKRISKRKEKKRKQWLSYKKNKKSFIF